MLNAIGIAYQDLNKPTEALRHFEEALAIRRRIGHKRGMASSLNNIAQVRADLGHPERFFLSATPRAIRRWTGSARAWPRCSGQT